MASVDVNTYSMNEWKVAFINETTLGTVNKTSMQLINLNGDVTVGKEIFQSLDVRSGSGRTLKTADVVTQDRGGMRTTITVPAVIDTSVDTRLHEGLLWTATGASPASVDVGTGYAPTALADGATPTANLGTYSVALISPIAGETRYFFGACIESLDIIMDQNVDGGRRTGTIVFVTEYREVDGANAPATPADYGSTFRYLRSIQTTKTIGGDVMVMNKLGYKITNNVTYAGQQGGFGEPELVQRAIPAIDVKITAGVKYDSNTAEWWENYRAGDTIAIEISDNATWASATAGVKADNCKITTIPAPSQTEQGAFMDVEFTATDDGTDPVIQIVP